MDNIQPPKQPLSLAGREKIVLDWKAYFVSFCELHGEPVLTKGRLLFRDGWTYSSTDYQGPEYPPPKNLDELDVLILEYWTLRQSTVYKQLLKLQHELKTIRDVAQSRSMPLKRTIRNEEGKTEAVTLTTDAIELKINWLSDDLLECDDRLKEIKQYHSTKEKGQVSV